MTSGVESGEEKPSNSKYAELDLGVGFLFVCVYLLVCLEFLLKSFYFRSVFSVVSNILIEFRLISNQLDFIWKLTSFQSTSLNCAVALHDENSVNKYIDFDKTKE